MSDHDGALSKQEALSELRGQIEQGKLLLSRTLPDFDTLGQADADRAAWAMHNKKILYHLFGDAAAMARFTMPTPDEERDIHPKLAQEVRRFQQIVLEQLVSLEKVSRLLQQMG